MKWKSVSFGIFDGKRGHREHAGVYLDGVDFRTTKRQERYIEGRLAAESWPEATEELVEFWTQVAGVFEACLPAEPPLDLVIVEIEPEGGQLKAYFNDTKNRLRQSPLVINAIVPVMSEEYDALPDPSESEEAERDFDTRILGMRDRARGALLESLRAPTAAAAMSELVSKHGLTLKIRWESSDPDEVVAVPPA